MITKTMEWTTPPAKDWSDRGGRFRAIVQIENGQIIKATLARWGVTRHVCFGLKPRHEQGWLPCHTEPWEAEAPLTYVSPNRTRRSCGLHPNAPSGNCYDCMVIMSAQMEAALACLRK